MDHLPLRVPCVRYVTAGSLMVWASAFYLSQKVLFHTRNEEWLQSCFDAGGWQLTLEAIDTSAASVAFPRSRDRGA